VCWLNLPALSRQFGDFLTKSPERSLDAMPVVVPDVPLEQAIFLQLDFPAATLTSGNGIFPNMIGQSKAH
jgi:hypothetical protein